MMMVMNIFHLRFLILMVLLITSNTCDLHWDTKTNCASCIGHWNILTNCTSCVNHWSGPECELCTPPYVVAKDCSSDTKNHDDALALTTRDILVVVVAISFPTLLLSSCYFAVVGFCIFKCSLQLITENKSVKKYQKIKNKINEKEVEFNLRLYEGE